MRKINPLYALKAKKSFESTHDASYFKENESIFYSVLETRPYMRALLGDFNSMKI